MNSLHAFFSFASSFLVHLKSTRLGIKNSKGSSYTETKASKRFDFKKPSLYLTLAFLFLGISSYLALQGENNPISPWGKILQSKGWQEIERANCPEKFTFAEIGNETESREIYQSESIVLASKLPLPDAPYICHEIKQPSFITEIE